MEHIKVLPDHGLPSVGDGWVVVMPETVPGLVPMIPGSTSPGNLTLPMGYTMIYPKWQWGTNDSHWILGDTVSDKPWNSLEF